MRRVLIALSVAAFGAAGCQLLLGIGDRTEATGADATLEGSEGGSIVPIDDAGAGGEGGCGIGLTMCGEGCVDTTSNARNCGECGHDCLSAACVGGACVAERVPTSSLGPVVTIANGEIYFRSADDDTIIATLRASRLDGGPERDVMPIGIYAGLYPVDGTRWLLVDHGPNARLRLVDLTTGTVLRTLFDSAESKDIRGLAVHGEDVFFTTRLHVRHVRLDGTGLGVVRTIDLVDESPFGATPAVDFTATHVYFGFEDRNPLVALTRDPKPTSMVIDQTTGARQVDYLSIDSAAGVLTWLTAGQVRELPLDGGAVATYPIAATSMRTFAREGDTLYVSSLHEKNSSLLRVDLRTHRTLLLGTNFRRNGQIALDSKYVYMAGFDGGIDRVAR